MEKRARRYTLPTESLPALRLSDHLADLGAIANYLESRGIQTRNTRITRYVEYLQNRASKAPVEESSVFKNSAGGPFKNRTDWYLYVLREIHELMWILRGLKAHVPRGADTKLAMVVNGSDFAALDTNPQSRNIQFELRIASYFCQAGYEVDLSNATDIVAVSDRHAFLVECKRVGSLRQLQRRLLEAKKQLRDWMPTEFQGRPAFGCIAADVTRAAFAHNGLTFGLTNDHSRDIVQEKLFDIAKVAERMLLFSDCENLIHYWFQIHIPALIHHPPMAVTRFSSYCIARGSQNPESRRAAEALCRLPEIGSKTDGREIPPQKLTRRKGITVPKGTRFNLDDALLTEYLSTGRITDREPQEIVAELTLNGVEHQFSFSDFKTLISSISRRERRRLVENIDSSRLELVLEMYIQRYPYRDSESDEKEPVEGPK